MSVELDQSGLPIEAVVGSSIIPKLRWLLGWLANHEQGYELAIVSVTDLL